jgi:hypothetical protein
MIQSGWVRVACSACGEIVEVKTSLVMRNRDDHELEIVAYGHGKHSFRFQGESFGISRLLAQEQIEKVVLYKANEQASEMCDARCITLMEQDAVSLLSSGGEP